MKTVPGVGNKATKWPFPAPHLPEQIKERAPLPAAVVNPHYKRNRTAAGQWEQKSDLERRNVLHLVQWKITATDADRAGKSSQASEITMCNILLS